MQSEQQGGLRILVLRHSDPVDLILVRQSVVRQIVAGIHRGARHGAHRVKQGGQLILIVRAVFVPAYRIARAGVVRGAADGEFLSAAQGDRDIGHILRVDARERGGCTVLVRRRRMGEQQGVHAAQQRRRGTRRNQPFYRARHHRFLLWKKIRIA